MDASEKQQRCRELVDELCDVDEGLTPWEVNFIDDMSHKDERYVFSDKQMEHVERIYNRINK